MATSTDVYLHYRALWSALTEKYRARLAALDPRMGATYAFHLAHNWHVCRLGRPGETAQNRAVSAMLDRYYARSAALIRRGYAEYDRAEHRHHVAEGDAGRYLWCKGCRAA